MRIGFTVLEVDRHQNAATLRQELSWLPHHPTEVFDARDNLQRCFQLYPNYSHIFSQFTNPGIAGLWVSTLNALHSLANSELDALLVLEDDMRPTPHFRDTFLSAIEELPPDWGLLSLAYRATYLDLFCCGRHLLDEPMKTNICGCFQTGDSWAWLWRREFAIHMCEALKDPTPGRVHGISDVAILAMFHNDWVSPWKAYSIKPSIGSLFQSGGFPSSLGIGGI